jgi:hypothetical protein
MKKTVSKAVEKICVDACTVQYLAVRELGIEFLVTVKIRAFNIV